MHFILRPELFTQTTRPSCVVVCDLRNAKRIADVTCAKCEKRVGHDLPFGPKGRHFVAFGSDAVKVFGVCHGRKALWTQLRNQDQFMNIERRNPSNFLNVAAARSAASPTTLLIEPMQTTQSLEVKEMMTQVATSQSLSQGAALDKNEMRLDHGELFGWSLGYGILEFRLLAAGLSKSMQV